MDVVPVQEKRNSADSLENFAKGIEEMFRKGKDQGPFALMRQVCRLMASGDEKVSAAMTSKWVEWRFGKPVQPIAGKDGAPIQVELVTNATFPSS